MSKRDFSIIVISAAWVMIGYALCHDGHMWIGAALIFLALAYAFYGRQL